MASARVTGVSALAEMTETSGDCRSTALSARNMAAAPSADMEMISSDTDACPFWPAGDVDASSADSDWSVVSADARRWRNGPVISRDAMTRHKPVFRMRFFFLTVGLNIFKK